MDKAYQVMAWTLAAVFAIVVLLSTYDAQALTLKSGEVYTKNGVQNASETASGKAQLAKNGYLVAAGNVYIQVGIDVVEVKMSDLRGKSKKEIAGIIGNAATEQLQDMNTAIEGTIAELNAEGMSAINAAAMSAQEIADHIMNSDEVTGAIVGVSDEVQAAVDEILANEIVTDAAGIEYNPNNGPCSGAGC